MPCSDAVDNGVRSVGTNKVKHEKCQLQVQSERLRLCV